MKEDGVPRKGCIYNFLWVQDQGNLQDWEVLPF